MQGVKCFDALLIVWSYSFLKVPTQFVKDRFKENCASLVGWGAV